MKIGDLVVQNLITQPVNNVEVIIKISGKRAFTKYLSDDRELHGSLIIRDFRYATPEEIANALAKRMTA